MVAFQRWRTGRGSWSPPQIGQLTDEHGAGWSVSWFNQVARTSDRTNPEDLKKRLDELTRSEYYDQLTEVFKEEGLYLGDFSLHIVKANSR